MKGNFAVIDAETTRSEGRFKGIVHLVVMLTGGDPHTPSAVPESGALQLVYNRYFEPLEPIAQGAVDVHGLTGRELAHLNAFPFSA